MSNLGFEVVVIVVDIEISRFDIWFEISCFICDKIIVPIVHGLFTSTISRGQVFKIRIHEPTFMDTHWPSMHQIFTHDLFYIIRLSLTKNRNFGRTSGSWQEGGVCSCLTSMLPVIEIPLTPEAR